MSPFIINLSLLTTTTLAVFSSAFLPKQKSIRQPQMGTLKPYLSLTFSAVTPHCLLSPAAGQVGDSGVWQQPSSLASLGCLSFCFMLQSTPVFKAARGQLGQTSQEGILPRICLVYPLHEYHCIHRLKKIRSVFNYLEVKTRPPWSCATMAQEKCQSSQKAAVFHTGKQP